MKLNQFIAIVSILICQLAIAAPVLPVQYAPDHNYNPSGPNRTVFVTATTLNGTDVILQMPWGVIGMSDQNRDQGDPFAHYTHMQVTGSDVEYIPLDEIKCTIFGPKYKVYTYFSTLRKAIKQTKDGVAFYGCWTPPHTASPASKPYVNLDNPWYVPKYRPPFSAPYRLKVRTVDPYCEGVPLQMLICPWVFGFLCPTWTSCNKGEHAGASQPGPSCLEEGLC